MSPLIRGLVVTIVLLLGGLMLTAVVGQALENRAERPVDQAFSPTSPEPGSPETVSSEPGSREPASSR